jgi:hypothetical protein
MLEDDYNDPYPYDQFGPHGGAAHGYPETNPGIFDDPSKPLDYQTAEYNNATPSPQTYTAYGASAGAAGVGAAMTRDKSMRGLPDSYGRKRGSVAPHAAMYHSPSGSQATPSGYDFDSTAHSESNPSTHLSRDLSMSTDHSRTRSTGARYSTGLYNSRPSQESYGPQQEHYASQNQRGYQPDAYRAASSPFSDAPTIPTAVAASTDPYGGYVEGDPTEPQPRRLSAPLSNPYLNKSRPPSIPPAVPFISTGFSDNRRPNSFRDEEDYEIERGHRVLKVANE